MPKKMLSIFLLLLVSLASSHLLARAFKPNVYECQGKDFSLTYSEATWNGVPVFIIRDKDSVTNKHKSQGDEISVAQDDTSILISVVDKSYSGDAPASFSLIAPKMMLDSFDQVVDFTGHFVEPDRDTYDEKLGDFRTYTITPLKCRASHHVE